MADPTVDLWAGDEVHFQQHGSRCRMWVPPETKDPVLLHAPTRRSVGYFGAVRLRDGRFYYCREADKFNGLSFFAFLKGLRRTSIRTGRRVVLITDNAKYHHALLHKPWREEHVLWSRAWWYLALPVITTTRRAVRMLVRRRPFRKAKKVRPLNLSASRQ